MGIGGFPETHPLSLRWLGMHGAAFANWAVNGEYQLRKTFNDPMVKIKDGADLLLAFGVRFDDRVTGKFEEFCRHGTIVHLDIDASELNKNRRANLTVVVTSRTRSRGSMRCWPGVRSTRTTPRGSNKSPRGSKRAFCLHHYAGNRRQRPHEGSSQRP